MNRKGSILFVSFLVVLFVVAWESVSSMEIGKEQENKEHHTEEGFQNHPYVETAAPKGALFYLRRFWSSIFVPDVPEGHALSDDEAEQLLNTFKEDRLTWLGHATFLIRLSGKNILTDPFLGEFASPLSWAGPRRFVEPGISIENLPPIDFIVVSHNHYDHLDDYTVSNIKDKEQVNVVVSLGLRHFFAKRGFKKIVELDWGESFTLNDIMVTSRAAVHDSARSTDDHNKTLWSSWVIESSSNSVLFVGDSGYSETIFKEIGQQHGLFRYAILPIGAYEPRDLMWMSHVTPEEAVKIGVDTLSQTLIASHWGTVSSLSDEPMWEPHKRFKKAGSDSGYLEKDLWVMKVGETRSIQ